jgi:hypothetical protein
MSRIYKSAKGKMIDIDKVKLANENTIAVGNMKINARGDKLGAGGQVVAGRNQLMDQIYAVPDAGFSPNDPKETVKQQEIMDNNKAKELHDLVNSLSVQTTSAEPAATADSEQKTPQPRGALASSIAKTVSVEQKPLPKPMEQRKARGPSRI